MATNNINIPDKAFTHAGTFHADDVFSAAFLLILNSDITIERGLEVPEGYDGLVFDIGFGEFDHHQRDNQARSQNGIPYASFGKLWKKFAPLIYSPFIVTRMDSDFIQLLDASDNGKAYSQLSDAVSAFNPAWDSEKSSDECFREAVEIAKKILEKQIEKYEAAEKAKETIKEGVKEAKDGLLILPTPCPWKENFGLVKHFDFIISPSNRGGYYIRAIPIARNSKTSKVPFPARWLGSSDEKIGLLFCHKENFLAQADTLEHAIKIAKIAQREYDESLSFELKE